MIVIMSGPSGVSKSYLCWEVIDDFKGFYLPKKFTTRKKRAGEGDREYYFVSEEQFMELMHRGTLEIYTRIYNNWYGISKEDLKDALAGQKDAIFILDVFIAQEFKSRSANTILVYILPLEHEKLAQYIKERGVLYGESYEERLRLLDEELEQWTGFDYVVPYVNSEVAYELLRSILIAERCRPGRFSPEVEPDRFLQFRSFPRLAVDLVLVRQR